MEELSITEARSFAKHFSDMLCSQHNLTHQQVVLLLKAISHCRSIILKSNLKNKNQIQQP